MIKSVYTNLLMPVGPRYEYRLCSYLIVVDTVIEATYIQIK